MEQADRRRFFRIDDRLRLHLERPSSPVAGAEDQVASFDPGGVLQEIDRRINLIINRARVQAPAVAELAELLNSKLNHVVDTLKLNEELARQAVFREHQVNISACGLSMGADEFYAPNENLILEVLFSPDDHLLRLMVRVVRCLPLNQGGYMLFVDFVGMRTEDQEYLIQYVVRRQSSFLQQLREDRRGSAVFE